MAITTYLLSYLLTIITWLLRPTYLPTDYYQMAITTYLPTYWLLSNGYYDLSTYLPTYLPTYWQLFYGYYANLPTDYIPTPFNNST